MKLFKKILSVLILFIALFMISGKTNLVKAEEVLTGTIGEEYEYNVDRYFRGVWVTPLAGNIPKCTNSNIEKYKAAIEEMFDIMEFYKMNALVFHVRIYNDALYPSKLNPKSSYYTCDTDLLPWVIEECHKRGIEFHAWLNPYRIKSSGGTTPEKEAATIKSKCPANVGSDPENILINPDGGVILNPGKPAVRKFIIDTCMEVIRNYDVDAIHFDDYFYISNVDDASTMAEYNPDNLSKDDWHREQVNLFIKGLSQAMREYNEENNRYVQLGISPSGVWYSAGTKSYVEYDEDGTCITNGSPTKNTFNHYGNYLYSDTKHWIDEEWIDYILPQTYWAIEHPSAYFKPLIKWWDDVVRYKKVNLYSGMGIYMGANGGNYSWGTDEYEAYKQIVYTESLDSANGTCIYNYDNLKPTYQGKDTITGKQLRHVLDDLWNNTTLPPIIKSQKSIVLPAVKDLSVIEKGQENEVSFNALDDAKFYAIYRSNSKVTFDSSELIAVIGDEGKDAVTFVDKEANGEKYSYGVKALSGNNTLGEGVASNALFDVIFKDKDGNVLKTSHVKYGEAAAEPVITDSNFVGWSRDISFVEKDMVVEARYKDSEFTVNFYDINGGILLTKKCKYEEKVEAPVAEVEGYNFLGWSSDGYNKVIYDLDIRSKYEIIKCIVQFGYLNPETNQYFVLSTKTVNYFDSVIPPQESEYPNIVSYKVTGWDKDYSCIKGDTKISLVIEPIYYTVTFINNEDDSIIEVQQVRYGEDAVYPEPPEVKGKHFESWRGMATRVLSDRVIRAMYGLSEYTVKFYDKEGNVIVEYVLCYEDEFDVPEIPEVEGYDIIGWDTDFSEVLSDLDIHPIYHKQMITITYIDSDGTVFKSIEVTNDRDYEADYDAPEIKGNGKDTEWLKEVDEEGNITFKVLYKDIEKTGCNILSIVNLLFYSSTILGIALLLKRRY